jgi:hypothetical protein
MSGDVRELACASWSRLNAASRIGVANTRRGKELNEWMAYTKYSPGWIQETSAFHLDIAPPLKLKDASLRTQDSRIEIRDLVRGMEISQSAIFETDKMFRSRE